MELDQFITKTLQSIIKGVNDAKEMAKENGARINPHIGNWDFEKTMTTYYGKEQGARSISQVDFDIAVTSSNEKEAGGEGGISVLSFKLGGKVTDKDSTETISRIKFSVNVALPNTEM